MVCLTDANTALYRMTTSSASGTVTLSAEAMEKRLRGQLERGEFTMGKIRVSRAERKHAGQPLPGDWGGVKLYHLGGA